MPRNTKTVIKPFAWGYGLVTAIISALALHFDDVALLLWAASIFTWILSVYWVKSYPEYDNWYNPSLKWNWFCLISAAVTAIFAVWNSSPWWLMYLFLLVWGADSGAYFVGRKFGKNKLAPDVSPNKSIEGFIGGLFTAMIIVIVVEVLYLDLSLARAYFILYSFCRYCI